MAEVIVGPRIPNPAARYACVHIQSADDMPSWTLKSRLGTHLMG